MDGIKVDDKEVYDMKSKIVYEIVDEIEKSKDADQMTFPPDDSFTKCFFCLLKNTMLITKFYKRLLMNLKIEVFSLLMELQ